MPLSFAPAALCFSFRRGRLRRGFLLLMLHSQETTHDRTLYIS
jgi:hypothetical protein